MSAIIAFETQHDDLNNMQMKNFLPTHCIKCTYNYPVRLMVSNQNEYGTCRWVFPIILGGGMVQGNKISIQCQVGKKCCILWNSTSYQKVYSCKKRVVSFQEYQYTINDESFLAILNQPLVCFRDSIYDQVQEFKLTFSANLILLDWMLSGRIEYTDERWDFVSYKNTVNIYIDSELVLKESQHMHSTDFLQMKKIMKDYNVQGTLLILGPFLSELSANILQKLGKIDSYGQKRKSDILFAVSPVFLHDGKQHGCLVKFFSIEHRKVYEQIEDMLRPVFKYFGANPFEGKY